MFRERDIAVQIHWSGDHGTGSDWFPKISDITPGSLVGLETDEGDLVKINVTRNVLWNFTGTIVDFQPDPPRSERIAVLQVGDEVTFGEANLIFVFSVPKRSIG